MSPADLARPVTLAVREGLSTFLGVAAVVAIAIGLMYLFAAGLLPHLLQGQAHPGPHARRGVVCLVAGSGCGVAAWLIRVRHPLSR